MKVWRQYQGSAAEPPSNKLNPQPLRDYRISGHRWWLACHPDSEVGAPPSCHISPSLARCIPVSSTSSNTATFLAVPQASSAKCEDFGRRKGVSNDCYSRRVVNDGGFRLDGDRISFLGAILMAEQIATWGPINRSINRDPVRLNVYPVIR